VSFVFMILSVLFLFLSAVFFCTGLKTCKMEYVTIGGLCSMSGGELRFVLDVLFDYNDKVAIRKEKIFLNH